VPSAEPHGLAWDAALGARSAGLIRPECGDGGSGWAEPGFCNNPAPRRSPTIRSADVGIRDSGGDRRE
jgi:hypothetical protein